MASLPPLRGGGERGGGHLVNVVIDPLEMMSTLVVSPPPHSEPNLVDVFIRAQVQEQQQQQQQLENHDDDDDDENQHAPPSSSSSSAHGHVMIVDVGASPVGVVANNNTSTSYVPPLGSASLPRRSWYSPVTTTDSDSEAARRTIFSAPTLLVALMATIYSSMLIGVLLMHLTSTTAFPSRRQQQQQEVRSSWIQVKPSSSSNNNSSTWQTLTGDDDNNKNSIHRRRSLLSTNLVVYRNGVLNPSWESTSFLSVVDFTYRLPDDTSTAILVNAQAFGALSVATPSGYFYATGANNNNVTSNNYTKLAFRIHALYPETGARLVLKLEARSSLDNSSRLFTPGVSLANLANPPDVTTAAPSSSSTTLQRGVLPLDRWYDIVVPLENLVLGNANSVRGTASLNALRTLSEIPGQQQPPSNEESSNSQLVTFGRRRRRRRRRHLSQEQNSTGDAGVALWLWDTITVQDDAGTGAAFLVDDIRLLAEDDGGLKALNPSLVPDSVDSSTTTVVPAATEAQRTPPLSRRPWLIAVIVGLAAMVCFFVVGIAVLVVKRREETGRGKHTSTADEVRGAMTELGENIGDMFEDMGGGVSRAVPHPRSTNKERTDSKQPPGWYSPHDEVPYAERRTSLSPATGRACCFARHADFKNVDSFLKYETPATAVAQQTAHNNDNNMTDRSLNSDERRALDEILAGEWRGGGTSVTAATTTTTEPRRDDDRVEDEELHEIHDQALWHLDIAEAKRRDAEAVRVEADRVESGEQLASVRASVDDDDDAEAASVETDDSEVGVKLTFREAAVDDGSPHAQAALLRRQSDALRAAAKVYESEGERLLQIWSARLQDRDGDDDDDDNDDGENGGGGNDGDQQHEQRVTSKSHENAAAVVGSTRVPSSVEVEAAAAMAGALVFTRKSTNEEEDEDEAQDTLGPLLNQKRAPLAIDFKSEIVLDNVLGSGASGSVWKVHYRPVGGAFGSRRVFEVPTDVPIAMKVMHSSAGGVLSPADQAAFEAEVSLLSALRHPNIVRSYGTCHDDKGNNCVLIEFVDGPSLYKALHEQILQPSWQATHRLAKQLASAMHYCHTREPFAVVHRDLKTHNVLLDRHTGDAKVCDFGIARRQAHTFLTTKHIHAGTAPYMAPETFKGGSRSVNEKCDVYSYGVILWECCAVDIPWKRETAFSPMSVVMAVGVEKRRLPLDPTWPRYLRRIIKMCWRHDPRVRASFAEVLRRLDDAEESGETSPHLPSAALGGGGAGGAPPPPSSVASTSSRSTTLRRFSLRR